MTLNGHLFARGVRNFVQAIAVVLAIMPFAAGAQPAALPPPAIPMAVDPAPMTLDQVAPLVAPAPAPEGQGTIGRIAVEGTQRIEADSVLSYLLLRQGQAYDAATADRSLKVLFDTGLFADVRLEWDGMTLTVRVVENPILNQVVYEGNSTLSEEDLNMEVQVRPRQVFTRARVQADVGRIIELYRRSGHFAATVEPKIIQRPQNRVDLVFEINEGPTTGVAAINFIGNRIYSDADLRAQIATTTSAWWKILSTNDNYDPDRLIFDREQLRRFYLQRGYADFRVVSAVAELTPDRQDFYVTFTVDEGEPYRFGKITVDSEIRDLVPDDLLPLVNTEVGDLYNAEEIDTSIEALTFAAGTRGFVFIDIRPVVTRNTADHTIDLVYRIEQGPRVYIERINIVGNVRTRDEVIRREFRLAEGDAFNRVLADRSRTRVRALGFFSEVTITEEPGTAPDRTALTVTLTEQATGELALGAGFSSQQGLLLDFSYTERNLFGRGQFLRASISLGTYQRDYDLRFTEPYFLGRPLQAGIILYKVITDYSEQIGYVSDVSSGGIQFGFPVSEFGKLSPHYNYQYSEIIPVFGAGGAVQLVGGAYSTSMLGYTYTYDTRDDIIVPTRGWNVALSQDIAGLGGDLKFLRTVAAAQYYHPWFFGLIANVSANVGYVSGYAGDIVPINERFFKGGPTFRGFQIAGIGPRDTIGEAAIGGNFYAIGSYIVRLPQFLPPDYGINLSLFSDFGTLGLVTGVNTTCTIISCVKDDLAFRASAGIAVNWRSPFGPVEIDFGIPFIRAPYDKGQNIRFSAGTNF